MSLFATQEYKQKGLEVIKSHFDYIRSYTKDLFHFVRRESGFGTGRVLFLRLWSTSTCRNAV